LQTDGLTNTPKHPDIPSGLKDSASIDYREFAAMDYLVEQIVGHEPYIYAHAKGGKEYLERKFDSIAGAGEYERILGWKRVNGEVVFNMETGDARNELRKIMEKRYEDNPEKIDAIDENVESIIKEGVYEI
jgi:hypothetical protein